MSLKKFVLTLLCCCSCSSNPVNNPKTELPEVPAYTRFSFNEPAKALDLVAAFLPADPVFIDAGSFDGREGAIIAKKWPAGHVYSFEPIPEIYQRLVATASTQDNMSTFELALSDKDGKAKMHVSEETGKPGSVYASSSLLAPKEHLAYAPYVNFPKQTEVNTLTIDSWAAKNNIKRVDMMWLDMQGVELEVLKASPKILATTQVILTEVEFVEAYAGQSLYTDLKAWLEGQGFIMIGGNFNPQNPKEGGQWFGDALFVRRELFKK